MTRLFLLAFHLLFAFLIVGWSPSTLPAKDFFVSILGDDRDPGTKAQPFRSIQAALDRTKAGDRVLVRGGRYEERLRFERSGNREQGFIQLRAFGGEKVVVDGARISGKHLVLMENVSYLRITGLEFVNNLDGVEQSAIRIQGSGSHIQLIENKIYEQRGVKAAAISISGSSNEAPLSHLKIEKNEISDCDSANHQAIEISGNVMRFFVTKNTLQDIAGTGIGILSLPSTDLDASHVPRNGEVAKNRITRIANPTNQETDSGTHEEGSGIRINGAKHITINANKVSNCEVGISIVSEQETIDCRRIVAQNNIIHSNILTGLMIGNRTDGLGTVIECRFINNTLHNNGSREPSAGQVWIRHAKENLLTNNIMHAETGQALLYSKEGNRNNTLNFNLWFVEAADGVPPWTWNDRALASFSDYQSESMQDQHSKFANPKFWLLSDHDYRLKTDSPAVGNGTNQSLCFAAFDFDDAERSEAAKIDIGAFCYIASSNAP